jgi:hypothetical protein
MLLLLIDGRLDCSFSVLSKYLQFGRLWPHKTNDELEKTKLIFAMYVSVIFYLILD